MHDLLNEMILFEESTRQTETPEFRQWFGNSKVVDSNGDPLVVYHGTNQEINKFSKARSGENTRSESSYRGFYFTTSPEVADAYAEKAANTQVTDAPNHEKKINDYMRKIEQASRRGDHNTEERLTLEMEELEYGAIQEDPKGQNIVPVYLSIQNPFVIDADENVSDWREFDSQIGKAKKLKYDGVILRNIKDDPMNTFMVSNHYVVFKSNQVKSAIGNKGTFNSESDNIVESN